MMRRVMENGESKCETCRTPAPLKCIFMPCQHAFCWNCVHAFVRCPECHDPDDVTAQVHAWPRLISPPST